MSRLSDRASPPGYEPVLRLSTRHDDEGGPCVALQVQGRGGDGHELLLLVHGYNNHRLEAEQAYDAFRRHQQPFLDADAARRLHRALGDLFWPGDVSLPGVLDLLDALAFGQAVQPALFTAGELADHLCARSELQLLHCVGHSLGCRLILQMLAQLAARKPHFKVGKVLLMAAAVPVGELAPGRPLRPGLTLPAQLRVLCSPDDAVLAGAFPLGQLLTGGSIGDEALGRFGDIPARPAGSVDVRWIEGAAHADYWGVEGDRGDARARRQAAAEIAAFLDWTTGPAERCLGDRPSVHQRQVSPPREAAELRELTRRGPDPSYLPG